ncbi:MAG TPA: DUF308 domain-containing protein [Acidimicrobiia bacterium]|jgi:uncharacterized membrane protein HdeD (DUF308 family)
MYGVLTRTWWLVLLRGLAGAGFGAAVLAWSGLSLEVLALAFGVFAVVDGTLGLLTALASDRHVWLLAADGAAGLAGGLVVLAWPGVPTLALVTVFSTWAVLRGATEGVAAWRLHRQCPREVTLGAAALAGLVAAALLASHPGESVLSSGRQAGASVAAAGLLLALLGVRLRLWVRASRRIHETLFGLAIGDRREQTA